MASSEDGNSDPQPPPPESSPPPPSPSSPPPLPSKKKRKPHDQIQYYRNNSPGNSKGYYNIEHANWNANISGEHFGKLPPPPGSVSSEHWPAVPPPPPPAMHSSEMSSSGFSGPHQPPLPPPHPSLALGFNQSTFTYEELVAATGGFARANLLGQGGFGYVHKGKGVPVMDFPTRLKIALGSAKGFAYLHEDCHPRIIHRDIKAANILLDYNYEAKVADFGLAKLSNDTNTHVSTRIMGTFGYLAPEYASSGKLTDKSDVYSFGIVLLELITGRCPIDIHSDDDSLVDWARPILMRATEGGSYEELVDPRLENDYDPQQMQCMVVCAAGCIRHSARSRPKMRQIVRALEGDVSLEDLNEGMKASRSSVFGSSGGSEFDGSYQSEMQRFKKPSTTSQEFMSGEHGITGEFSVRSSPSSGGNSREIRPNGSRMHTP
ncbi:protein kinase superfamily protein [Actinidia rufa]|uniref:non-specific serine/threonine protein kinase n=1 Tax=Actinidia rufa TaxID=165716 RepID=A0A7J0EU97_9ERIC|nr:protein kinase superfamily protein [Actinidia rufa]